MTTVKTSGKMLGAAVAGLVMLLVVWEVAPARWAALLLVVIVLALMMRALQRTPVLAPVGA